MVPQPMMTTKVVLCAITDPMAPIVVSAALGLSMSVRSDGSALACPQTRLQNNIKKPNIYMDGTICYAYLTTSGQSKSTEEPLSHEQWRGAMNDEYQALLKNQTWHLVPPNRATNVIDYKWVYKIKRKQDGSIDRYKVRLVAKGFKQ
jgi:hypothetical protein